jgi:hypothetical protein
MLPGFSAGKPWLHAIPLFALASRLHIMVICDTNINQINYFNISY